MSNIKGLSKGVELVSIEFNTAVKYVTRQGFVNDFPITFDYKYKDYLRVLVGFQQRDDYTILKVDGVDCVRFNKNLAEGASVTIRRVTPSGAVPHIYQYTSNAQGGAEFSAKTIDENFEYMSKIVSEVEDYNTISQDNLNEIEDSFKDTQKVANEAKDTAERAEGKIDSAVSIAEEAKGIAEGIDGKAQEALANSVVAKDTAEGIDGKAQLALDNSSEALGIVESAKVTADNAKDVAEGIDSKAQDALDNSIKALDKVDTKRDLVDNVFSGSLQLRDNDGTGTGVFLMESDGTIRGQMVSNSYGLQFSQIQEDGTHQNFTFPRYGDGGEILTDGRGKWVLPDNIGVLKVDAFSLTESGNVKENGEYGNDKICKEALSKGKKVYVPEGVFYLSNPMLYSNLAFYGEGTLKYDNAEFVRLGGSSGSTRASEQYTLYYSYASKSDVSVLVNDNPVPFTWLDDWLIDVPAIKETTRDDIVRISVIGGTYKCSYIPEYIAMSSTAQDLDPEYNQSSVAWGKGSHTTKLGSRAGQNALHANNSVFIGAKAGASVVEKGNNVFMGFNSGQRVKTGNNTMVGSVAGEWVTAGSENTYFGMGAGAHNIDGNRNLSAGNYALNHPGSNNVALGYNASSSIGSGVSSSGGVHVGAFSSCYQSGDRNVSVGYASRRGNVVENYSLVNIGTDNVSMGYHSSFSTAQASNNVSIGKDALYSNAKEGSLVAIGSGALYSNTEGRRQVAVGFNSLYNSNAEGNTALGYQSGYNISTGFRNTFIGEWAGKELTASSNNTFVGWRAGYLQEHKGNNTFIGSNTGATSEEGLDVSGVQNSSALGYGAKVTGDDQVQLGGASTTTYVFGTVQNRSDARDKADIKELDLGLDFVMKLKPSEYIWNYREWEGKKTGKRKHAGFIAQDVQEVVDSNEYAFVQDHSVNGGADVLSIGYDEFIPVLTKAIQEQQKLIKELREEVNKLKEVK